MEIQQSQHHNFAMKLWLFINKCVYHRLTTPQALHFQQTL